MHPGWRRPMKVGRRWSLLAPAVGIVAVSYGMARFGVGLAAPQLTADGVVTDRQLAAASAGSYATYVLAALGCALLLRGGRWRLSLVPCVVTAVTGCLLMASAGSAAPFVSGATIAGSAAGFASGAVAYRLTRVVDAADEPRSQAIANAGTGIGVAVATLLVLLTGEWRSIFAGAAILMLGLAAPMLRGGGGAGDRGRHQVDKPGRRRDLVIPVLCTICLGAGSSVFWTFGRTMAEDSAGLSATASLVFWGAVGVFGVLGALSGDVTTAVGTARAWCLGSLILATSLALLPLTTSFPLIVATGAVFGAVYVVMCGLTIELAREAWPRAMGTSTSILFATIAVGQAAGSALTSVLVGPEVEMGIVFTAGGAVAAAGAALIWLVDRTQVRAARTPASEGAGR